MNVTTFSDVDGLMIEQDARNTPRRSMPLLGYARIAGACTIVVDSSRDDLTKADSN
jgi:hypothetical protein